ncbi:MAG: hypothetical protein WC784_01215 [Candidatus Shapirobacteria bacterium]|jgi:hypothetical protein
MKFITGFILAIVIIAVIVPVFVFLYFFSGSPRDLGVKYTPADYTQIHQEIGTEVVAATSSASIKDSIQFSGQKEIKISLNSAEITAYFNADKYINNPLSQVQIKINPDGTGEASGILNLQKFVTFVSLTTSTDEVQKAIDKFHINANPPFYAKGTVTVVNNQVNFNFSQLEIGRIPVPENYVSENLGAVNNYATKTLNSIPNLQVRSLTLSDSKVNLDATVPEKVIKVEK